MKTLTLELEVADEVYEALGQMAAKQGQPIEDLVLEWRARYGPRPRPKLSDAQRRAARKRLLRFAGSVNSGDPHSADNEKIDADLAREYASTHEEE